MQTVTEAFKAKSRQAIRPITYKALASFNKTYSASTNFFTIGTSTIGGIDIIKGENTVIQEWDKYDYEDISSRVLSIEYTRESEPPIGAVTMAMADVVLDNQSVFLKLSSLKQRGIIFMLYHLWVTIDLHPK